MASPLPGQSSFELSPIGVGFAGSYEEIQPAIYSSSHVPCFHYSLCRDMKLVRITKCLRLDGPIDKHEETTRLLLGVEDNLKAVQLAVSLYNRNTNPFPPERASPMLLSS